MKLPILLIEAHSRCNCRCEMCDIWMSTDKHEFSLRQLEEQLPSIEQLQTRWIVFTGGEPLMHSNLFALCSLLRKRGIQVSILSTGLLFERFAQQIAEHVDSAIVSIDGPPELHDSIRGVSGGFAQIERGIRAIREIRAGFPIAARTVVQRRNYSALDETAAAARAIGLDSISFLAADLASTAFNRAQPWSIVRQNDIALTASQLLELDHQLELLAQNPFVIDSRDHLLRIANSFKAHLGLRQHEAPRCNAPWVSALLTSQGKIQPCFFHHEIGSLEEGSLAEAVEGRRANDFRSSLRVAENPTCKRCVCSLNLRDA